jgi:hypothetical protein
MEKAPAKGLAPYSRARARLNRAGQRDFWQVALEEQSRPRRILRKILVF